MQETTVQWLQVVAVMVVLVLVTATATKTLAIQITKKYSRMGVNRISIVIRVVLSLMERLVVVPAEENIATQRRMEIRIHPNSRARWLVTSSAIICGTCSAS